MILNKFSVVKSCLNLILPSVKGSIIKTNPKKLTLQLNDKLVTHSSAYSSVLIAS